MNKALIYIAASAFVIGIAMPAYADEKKVSHPEIEQAIHDLESSRKELKNAGSGFGGYRGQALKNIDDAMQELHAAIQYADSHPNSRANSNGKAPEPKIPDIKASDTNEVTYKK